ncbi:MAG TPA: D-arabinono-1,4-lactone oxidase, partial [Polyangia bacterium]
VSPPFNGRAHWGKNRRSLFQLQRRLGAYGDNMTRFRSVVATMDPTGMFANQFGVDMGLRWPRLAKPIPVDSDVAGCSP